MALTKEQIAQLYVSIFDRAPEGEGMNFWLQQDKSVAEIAEWMLATDDSKEYFGDVLNDNQKFVEFVYENTLGKTAKDDPKGVKFWVESLNNGTYANKGEMIAALVYAAQQPENAGPAQDQFNNRVKVALEAAEKIEKAPENYKEALGFKTEANPNGALEVDDTEESVKKAEEVINKLASADEKKDDAQDKANEKKDDAQDKADEKKDNAKDEKEDLKKDAANIIKLKETPDNISGTDGDDLFDGSVVQNDKNGLNVNTYSSEDMIDGKDGNDSIIIEYSRNDNTTDVAAGAGSLSGVITNVEDMKFRAFTPVTFDMSNVSGVKSFTNQYSVANFSATNVDTALDLTVKGVNTSTSFTFDNNVYSGNDDSFNLTLEKVTKGADISLNGGTIETLNIESKTGSNNVDIGGSALSGTTKLVITGDQYLSLDDITDIPGDTGMTSLSVVDASALDANLNLDLRNSQTKLDVLTGKGDDLLVIRDLDKDDKIDMGDGKDMLFVALDKNANTAPTLLNIEQMGFRTTANNSYTVNMDETNALEEIYLENQQDGTADTVTLKKVHADTIKSVNFVNHDQRNATSLDNLVLKLDDASATDNSLEVNFTSVQTLANPIDNRMADNNILTLNNIQIDGIENVSINTKNLSKDNDGDTDPTDAGLVITNLQDDALKSLTISSDTYLSIGSPLSNTVNTIDASATTGGVNLDLTNVQDGTTKASLSVKTGSGSDTVANVFATQAVASSNFDLGAGNDRIVFSGNGDVAVGTANSEGSITINAGDGNDIIDISSIQNFVTGVTTPGNHEVNVSISGGEGSDIINLNGNINQQRDILIKDFEAGNGGDKIVFANNMANDGATDTANPTQFRFADNAADNQWDNTLENFTINSGLTVIDEQNGDTANSLSAADIATFLAGKGASIGITAGTDAYIVVTDGSNAALAYVDDANGNSDGVIDANEISIVAILGGVEDTGTLNIANFADNFIA